MKILLQICLAKKISKYSHESHDSQTPRMLAPLHATFTFLLSSALLFSPSISHFLATSFINGDVKSEVDSLAAGSVAAPLS